MLFNLQSSGAQCVGLRFWRSPTMAAESKLERECKDYIEIAYEGKLTKLKSPGDNGFPDRIILIPNCPPIFAEFKSKIGIMRPRQKTWRGWLKRNGFIWVKVNDFHVFCETIDDFTEYNAT